MAGNKGSEAAKPADKPADPRAVLKAKLVAIHLAGKRFAEDEKWMKDAIEAALNTKLEAKLTALVDTDVATVLGVLDMAK